MPAELVAITEEHRTPKAHQERLAAKMRNARTAVLTELKQYENSDDLQRLVNAYASTLFDLHSYWERRAVKAERDLQGILGAHLNEDQRARVYATLRVDTRRDPYLLSENEATLIEHYRALDAEARTMLRTLVARLARTSHDEKGGALMEQNPREIWEAATRRWLPTVFPALAEHAHQLAQGERGVLFVTIDTDVMEQMLAGSAAVRLDPIWRFADQFIEIITQHPSGLEPDTPSRWAASLKAMDAVRDVALFLASTPDAEGHWFSRFVVTHDGSSPVH